MNLDFADVKPSIISWFLVGIMAATFIVALKMIVNKYPVPGLTELINAV